MHGDIIRTVRYVYQGISDRSYNIARVCKKTYGFLVYNYHSIDI